MVPRDDGYIRIRCKECGKKLKAKKEFAGQMFTCRVCKAANVLPFADEDAAEQGDSTPAQATGSDGTALGPNAEARWTPQVNKRTTHIPEIDNLLNSMFKCYKDAFERVQNMLSDSEMSPEQQEAALRKIKLDRDVAVRSLVIRGRDSIDGRLAKLRNHPMSQSAAILEQFSEAVRQRTAFETFAKCFFE